MHIFRFKLKKIIKSQPYNVGGEKNNHNMTNAIIKPIKISNSTQNCLYKIERKRKITLDEVK